MKNLIRPFSPNYNPIIGHEINVSGGHNRVEWHWARIRVVAADFTAAAGSEALDLAALVAANPAICSGPFPGSEVMTTAWSVDLVEEFAGGAISAATIILGISGTTNGYLTTTDVFTGAGEGWKQTPSASLWTPRRSGTLTPLLTLATTSDDVANAEEGILDVHFHFCMMPVLRTT